MSRPRSCAVGMIIGGRRVLKELPDSRTGGGENVRHVQCICLVCGVVADRALHSLKGHRCRECSVNRKRAAALKRFAPLIEQRHLRVSVFAEAQARAPWLWGNHGGALSKEDRAALEEVRLEAVAELAGLVGPMLLLEIAALTGVKKQAVEQSQRRAERNAARQARARGMSPADIPERGERTWPEPFGEAA